MKTFRISAKIEEFIEHELTMWNWDSGYGVDGVKTTDVDVIIENIRESTPLTVYWDEESRGNNGSLDGMDGNYGITIENELDLDEDTFAEWYRLYGDVGSLEIE